VIESYFEPSISGACSARLPAEYQRVAPSDF
jgi:hypothetical protein